MHKCNVMFFAAGLGTRLIPHTQIHPKPCITLFNIPLGYYLLPYFQKLTIEAFAVNTFHLPDQIQLLYKNINSTLKIEPKFSNETDFIKGSGGGLKQAQHLLGSNQNIVLCNSDEVFFTKEEDFLNLALKKHDLKKALATLVVIKHPEAGIKFGAIWCDENNKVIGIGKEPPVKGAIAWHFIGVQILSPKIFSYISENKELNIFYDILIHYLNNEYVQVYPIAADWYETGNINDYSYAKKEIINKTKSELYYQNHFNFLNQIPKLSWLKISDLS